MNTQLQTLKGFRDFLPEEKRQREYVAGVMKRVFTLYGFEPIETPALEYASLLMGKYGDEADKLVYRFTDRGEREVALRYDQTVPTSRVLAQYQNELPRYFRRYQIQDVFRAEKPQKGRFREFCQADCDIFGSTSPLADAEILAVFYQVFAQLGFKSLVIEINDRDTLFAALSPFATAQVPVISISQSLDKLDKQTREEVTAELVAKCLTMASIDSIFAALQNIEYSDNLQRIEQLAISLGVPKLVLKRNPYLARGLDYYNGLIFEGKVSEYGGASVGGGGRYDKLIEQLSGLKMPAQGFGIGFDRTVEAAAALNLIPIDTNQTQVLVTVFSEELALQSAALATQLRQANIRTELSPAVDKLGKQFKLADQKRIRYVVILGEEEIAKQQVKLKDLTTGQEELLTLPQLISLVGLP